MTFELDLTEVEAWEGGLGLPPGEYRVEVDEAKETTSTNGFPQLELELRAVDGDQKGGTIRDWITVTAKSAGRVKQVLVALGVDASGRIKLEAADLVGKRARIVVRNEMGTDGKERARVKAYQPVGEPVAAGASNGAKADDSDLPF